MQRSIILTLLAASFAGPALANGFTGPAAPANFVVSLSGSLVGPLTAGGAVFSATELALTGGDASTGCDGGVYATLPGPCEVRALLLQGGDYRFDWAYASADGAGPAGDIFGVVVDGQVSALSDPGGAVSQSGSRLYTASSSFGWFLNCTDCTGGNATVTLSNFSTTAVPEPASALLMLAGLAGAGALRRWRAG